MLAAVKDVDPIRPIDGDTGDVAETLAIRKITPSGFGSEVEHRHRVVVPRIVEVVTPPWQPHDER
jgi:hypothetical protein